MARQAQKYSSRQFNRSADLVIPRQPSPRNNEEVKFILDNVPYGYTTCEVYALLKDYGLISRIDISKQGTSRKIRAYITFNPLTTSPEGTIQRFNTLRSKDIRLRQTQLHLPVSNLNRITTHGAQVEVSAARVGMMKDEKTALFFQRLVGTGSSPLTISMNVESRRLVVTFGATFLHTACDVAEQSAQGHFRIHMPFSEVAEIRQLQGNDTRRLGLLVRCSSPPLVYRRPRYIDFSQTFTKDFWHEDHALLRQTHYSDDHVNESGSTQLQPGQNAIDIGRWLTYFFEFDEATAASTSFDMFYNALVEHSVPISKDTPTEVVHSDTSVPWKYTETLFSVSGSNIQNQSNGLSDLDLIGGRGIYLPFEVQYHLEACLSYGIVNETNIDSDFISKLASIEPAKASKLLETAIDAAEDHRRDVLKCPMDIFKLLPSVIVSRRRTPSYRAMMRSVVITPTTMYINPPVMETSNRVVRKFASLEDRFLRVKFTDERYKGRIFSDDDNKMNALFTRIKRTMMNGIKIGDRIYHFLAFGNSQFRDGGAYFFANTAETTAQDIRTWMGDLTRISEVAKHCSRLGQGFSTTRPTAWVVNMKPIHDIERNGYNFTDGVGKISPFLSFSIAQEHGIPSSAESYPSAFQFRLAGCKGVLAVDPKLIGAEIRDIHIRPSQEKFPAEHRGLEICRIAKFYSANLNVQLILVLSALGVPDEYFLKMMREMLRDLGLAMTDENKAVQLLQKNIDFNHMTIKLAEMIQNGFMHRREPFMMTCLHLWRSWTIKYLKEKARIFVEKAAFVLGCVDEYGILKGHFDTEGSQSKDPDILPQIFLRIPSTTKKGQWDVIKGPCVVARNPSLHPGDVRVVNAIDVPKLYHLKNCVVFPQTGDRDIPNMLAGGDLDGDDFIVIWDQDLLPQEWNLPPMDYSPPPPVRSKGAVTVDDMTSFFVEHMRYDNLARIAVAHRYWADFCEDGVKNEKCIELAQLHSKAVDFQKTGVAAKMPSNLRSRFRPHWSGATGKNSYHSKKILGKLYDEAQQMPFEPAWDLPFDDRIMNAYDPPEALLAKAKQVKQQYDISVRRLMAKFGIESEFEVWSTFVLKHSNDIGDYKFAETLGDAVHALKEHHQDICYEEAGTTRSQRDPEAIQPFIAAMYIVTATEIKQALNNESEASPPLTKGRKTPAQANQCKLMPLMSFPWIFSEDLGRIAKESSNEARAVDLKVPQKQTKKVAHPPAPQETSSAEDSILPIPEITTEQGVIQGGELLDIFHHGAENGTAPDSVLQDAGPPTIRQRITTTPPFPDLEGLEIGESPCNGRKSEDSTSDGSDDIFYEIETQDMTPDTQTREPDFTRNTETLPEESNRSAQSINGGDPKTQEQDEDDGEEGVVVTIEIQQSSALDALDRLLGL